MRAVPRTKPQGTVPFPVPPSQVRSVHLDVASTSSIRSKAFSSGTFGEWGGCVRPTGDKGGPWPLEILQILPPTNPNSLFPALSSSPHCQAMKSMSWGTRSPCRSGRLHLFVILLSRGFKPSRPLPCAHLRNLTALVSLTNVPSITLPRLSTDTVG